MSGAVVLLERVWPAFGVNIYELAIAIQAPTSMTGTALSGRVNRLTWRDNATNESGFEVQRALKNGNTCGSYATIGTAPLASGSGSTVTSNDIGSGNNAPVATKTYCYRVRKPTRRASPPRPARLGEEGEIRPLP